MQFCVYNMYVITNFSPSPTHFEPNVAAVGDINVALHCEAIVLAIMVLPVPGGPNNSTPWKKDG